MKVSELPAANIITTDQMLACGIVANYTNVTSRLHINESAIESMATYQWESKTNDDGDDCFTLSFL